ncbi:MAG: alpha/beta hydrolase [Pseudomonadales bacterium]|nr:alpha/beta hydrolase [Pseudomonadales bacterium]
MDIVKLAVDQQAPGPVWILGHSVGGAIATLFAEQYPELVLGFINVEGNFSLQDAFWCQKISQLAEADWLSEYRQMQADPEQLLRDSDIQITEQRTNWARAILQHQSASAVQGVAKAVVKDTGAKAYQQSTEALIERKIPYFLVAGEHSAPDWQVPQSVISSAIASYQIPGTGHMMMLQQPQQPQQFCQLIAEIISPGK